MARMLAVDRQAKMPAEASTIRLASVTQSPRRDRGDGSSSRSDARSFDKSLKNQPLRFRKTQRLALSCPQPQNERPEGMAVTGRSRTTRLLLPDVARRTIRS